MRCSSLSSHGHRQKQLHRNTRAAEDVRSLVSQTLALLEADKQELLTTIRACGIFKQALQEHAVLFNNTKHCKSQQCFHIALEKSARRSYRSA